MQDGPMQDGPTRIGPTRVRMCVTAVFQEWGYGNLPVCMAKTQYSFSHDAGMLGAPSGFELPVREFRLNAGAGFVVAILGSIMTMPGLPKRPAANDMDMDEDGNLVGVFG